MSGNQTGAKTNAHRGKKTKTASRYHCADLIECSKFVTCAMSGFYLAFLFVKKILILFYALFLEAVQSLRLWSMWEFGLRFPFMV